MYSRTNSVNSMMNRDLSFKKESPLISVVINCHNGERYLRDAINSIYAQTYKNWEIIFWDNASTDNSSNIVNTYSNKIKYFLNKDKTTLGQARNLAIKKCNGNFIAFLDCDDIWLANKLEKQIKVMQSDNSIVVCYGNGFYMYGEQKTKSKFSSGKNSRFYRGDIFNHLICSNFINWQTVLINKELASNDLFFNENLTFAEDQEILLRLSLLGHFEVLDEPLAYYRIHKNNMSNNYLLILEEAREIYRLFETEIIKRKIDSKVCMARLHSSVAIQSIKKGNSSIRIAMQLIKYPNIQNIIIFIVIILGISTIFKKYLKMFDSKNEIDVRN